VDRGGWKRWLEEEMGRMIEEKRDRDRFYDSLRDLERCDGGVSHRARQ